MFVRLEDNLILKEDLENLKPNVNIKSVNDGFISKIDGKYFNTTLHFDNNGVLFKEEKHLTKTLKIFNTKEIQYEVISDNEVIIHYTDNKDGKRTHQFQKFINGTLEISKNHTNEVLVYNDTKKIKQIIQKIK